MFIFGVESLNALLLLLEWVNRLELSSETAEEDVSSSPITLVDDGGMTLIKGRVYRGGAKLTMLCAMTCIQYQ